MVSAVVGTISVVGNDVSVVGVVVFEAVSAVALFAIFCAVVEVVWAVVEMAVGFSVDAVAVVRADSVVTDGSVVVVSACGVVGMPVDGISVVRAVVEVLVSVENSISVVVGVVLTQISTGIPSWIKVWQLGPLVKLENCVRDGSVVAVELEMVVAVSLVSSAGTFVVVCGRGDVVVDVVGSEVVVGRVVSKVSINLAVVGLAEILGRVEGGRAKVVLKIFNGRMEVVLGRKEVLFGLAVVVGLAVIGSVEVVVLAEVVGGVVGASVVLRWKIDLEQPEASSSEPVHIIAFTGVVVVSGIALVINVVTSGLTVVVTGQQISLQMLPKGLANQFKKPLGTSVELGSLALTENRGRTARLRTPSEFIDCALHGKQIIGLGPTLRRAGLDVVTAVALVVDGRGLTVVGLGQQTLQMGGGWSKLGHQLSQSSIIPDCFCTVLSTFW